MLYILAFILEVRSLVINSHYRCPLARDGATDALSLRLAGHKFQNEIVILSKARNRTNVRSIYSNTCTRTLDFKDWD